PAVGERMQVVRGRGVDAAVLAAQLAADLEVEFAVPNGRQRIAAIASGAPTDPLYPAMAPGVRPQGPDSGQWTLRAPTAAAVTQPGDVVSAIDIEAAWVRTTGSANVVVAVLDTGVRFEHPDLGRAVSGGALLPGYDFVSNATIANDGNGRDGDPSDPGDWVTAADLGNSSFSGCEEAPSSWHGTSTASLIGAATGFDPATPGVGMAGAAPGVRVLPVRVLGKCYGTDADIQAAMLWAGGLPVDGVPRNPNPARVINMSLGSSGSCSAAYQSVMDRLTAAGVVVVVAAGNSAGGPVGTPGNCDGAIAVLGLRHAGSKVGFSDLGPEIAISAPAGNCVNVGPGDACLYPIVTATNSGAQGPAADGWTDSFNFSVGTSFASPLVAAVAGLMVSQQPALTPAEVRSALQSTARPFPSSGADNGPDDPTPVPSCYRLDLTGPTGQCYCPNDGQLCGAGMLDAGRAVAAVTGALARIEIATAAPTAGSAVTLSGANSLPAAGGAVSSYAWTLVDSGGIVSGFSSATNAPTATLLPGAAGSFTVRLTVTDTLGNASEAETRVTVAAAPAPPSGGGGGLASAPWVGGVALAALVLLPGSRRRRGALQRLPRA
ncbi:MAG TPA: S8 family serine peptidase, partial [Rubrivivax sp.]|nr:S8 family serine peptidase [Rubrivivax sp.]